MKLERLILVLMLIGGASYCGSAQMRIIPREKIEKVTDPRLSSDSASLDFETRHIVAEPMNEDDAPSTYVFRFTNIGKKPLKIDRLVSTCSCAAASADRMDIKPGEKGEISVRYNPKGHPGRFERRVFVYTSGGDDPAAVLKLTVMVENGSDLSGLWPVQMGSIRLRRATVDFAREHKAVEKLRFLNLSGKPLRLQCENAFLPECLSFRTEPEVVEDGKEGEIIITYDPSVPGAREQMGVILKGLGVPPSRSTIRINCHSELDPESEK